MILYHWVHGEILDVALHLEGFSIEFVLMPLQHVLCSRCYGGIRNANCPLDKSTVQHNRPYLASVEKSIFRTAKHDE